MLFILALFVRHTLLRYCNILDPAGASVDKSLTQIGLALGSNIGDRLAAMQAAIAAMKPFLVIDLISPIYETAAAYVTDQPAFLNAALVGQTGLTPQMLLWHLKNIEIEIGRLPSFRYGPRLLDIDIIFYGDLILQSAELTLPHPRLAERDFVLKPLADIAPIWRHPLAGLTAEQMLQNVPEASPTLFGRLAL